jgi:hypothetical protein
VQGGVPFLLDGLGVDARDLDFAGHGGGAQEEGQAEHGQEQDAFHDVLVFHGWMEMSRTR